MEPAKRLVFHSSFLTLWRWTSIVCGIFGAMIYAFAWFLGQQLSVPPTIFVSVMMGLLFAVAVVLYPVYVFPDGVKCYNFWGLYRTIPWHEMGEMKRASILGLPYLVVNSESKGSIYLPLYLADQHGFIAALKERAGEHHPLVLAL